MADRPARSGRRDPKGHYAALGVPVTASAEQIKLAFRRKAKDVHPDLHPGGDTKDAFLRLNEAYQTLSRPEARARYDNPAAERPAAGPARPATAASQPFACSHCGAVTLQPRYAIFWRVTGFVVGTRRQPVEGVFCRLCADGRAWRASALTWLLGWWGVPWGPYWTVKALWRNMLGGERPDDANAALLRQLTLHFITTGSPVLARAALEQGLRLVRKPELRQKLQKLRVVVGDGSRDPRLPDRWRPAAGYGFYLHLLPLALVGIGLTVLAGGAFEHLRGRPAAPAAVPVVVAPPPAPVEHAQVTAGSLVLRAGPGPGQAVIGRLYHAETVEVLERSGGWVHVRTAAGQVGYVAEEYLAR